MISLDALVFCRVPTPLGRMIAAADDAGLGVLEFCDECGAERIAARLRNARESRELVPGEHPHLSALRSELAEYFAGERQAFSVPLAPLGTEFQRRAWAYLRSIPFGQTRTYGQQALAIQDRQAVRAVGRANGANPLAIVVPCHRVIGADGALTGYAGGIDRKQWLLDHERRCLGQELFDAVTATCAARS